MRFEDRPDYDYLRGLFIKLLGTCNSVYGLTKEMLKFDWCFEDPATSIWNIFNKKNKNINESKVGSNLTNKDKNEEEDLNNLNKKKKKKSQKKNKKKKRRKKKNKLNKLTQKNGNTKPISNSIRTRHGIQWAHKKFINSPSKFSRLHIYSRWSNSHRGNERSKQAEITSWS